jgi:hypothetical protein
MVLSATAKIVSVAPDRAWSQSRTFPVLVRPDDRERAGRSANSGGRSSSSGSGGSSRSVTRLWPSGCRMGIVVGRRATSGLVSRPR